MHKFVCLCSACATSIKWNHDAPYIHKVTAASTVCASHKHIYFVCWKRDLREVNNNSKERRQNCWPHTRPDLICSHFNFMKVLTSATSTSFLWNYYCCCLQPLLKLAEEWQNGSSRRERERETDGRFSENRKKNPLKTDQMSRGNIQTHTYARFARPNQSIDTSSLAAAAAMSARDLRIH